MCTQRLAWTTRGGAYKSLDDFISARRRRGRREKAHKREERVLNFKVINLDGVVFGTVSKASTTKIYMPKYVYINITIIIMILREDCSSGTSLLSLCHRLPPSLVLQDRRRQCAALYRTLVHPALFAASVQVAVVVVVISPNRYCERPLFTGHNLHDKQLARSFWTPGGFLCTRVSADDVLPSARG